MRILKITLIAALGFILVPQSSLKAQEGSTAVILNYTPSTPVGEITDFVDDFSWRGFSFEVRQFLSDYVSVGIVSGWNVYRSESEGIVSETIRVGNIPADMVLTANQYRFVNTVPILATAHYYMAGDGMPRPYLGIGVGGYYTEEIVEMGLYRFKDTNFQFGIAPTVGILIPAGVSSSINLGVTYDQAFGGDNSRNIGTMKFNFGVAWGL